MNIKKLTKLVNNSYDDEKYLNDKEYTSAINETIELLDKGTIRVTEKIKNEWLVNEWVKKAILLYFKICKIKKTEIGPFEFYDKIPLKKNYDKLKVRVVPPGIARYGCYIKQFPSGEYYVQCALIIGKRKESTDKKVTLNQVLRDFNISV